MYSVILNGPVPINSLGLLHQLTGSFLMIFSSRIMPEVDCSASAERKNPAGLARLMTTVYGSGAVSPDISNAVLPAASWSSMFCCIVFPAGGVAAAAVWTAAKPFTSPKIEPELGPLSAAARFQEQR